MASGFTMEADAQDVWMLMDVSTCGATITLDKLDQARPFAVILSR